VQSIVKENQAERNKTSKKSRSESKSVKGLEPQKQLPLSGITLFV